MNYQILDSGSGKRLEKIGDYVLIRPFAPAIWEPSLPNHVWESSHAEFKGSLEGGNGKWIYKKEIQKDFILQTPYVNFECRLTDYGHTGFFYEQVCNWEWLSKNARKDANYLNLFAYTGGSTIALARHSFVTHLDASKSVVNWARKNAKLSNIKEKNIRWITDDALKFVKKEVKRKKTYQGIIMDPPTFGRGAKGEIWKIEKHLIILLKLCKELLSKDAHLFLLSAHAHGFNHFNLKNILTSIFPEQTNISSKDMILNEKHSLKKIPLGSYARWTN